VTRKSTGKVPLLTLDISEGGSIQKVLYWTGWHTQQREEEKKNLKNRQGKEKHPSKNGFGGYGTLEAKKRLHVRLGNRGVSKSRLATT